jgi:hypothetical protein
LSKEKDKKDIEAILKNPYPTCKQNWEGATYKNEQNKELEEKIHFFFSCMTRR